MPALLMAMSRRPYVSRASFTVSAQWSSSSTEPERVTTSAPSAGAKKTLEVIEMSHYFNIVITANDIQNPKPHPETFLKCAELMGIAPKDCVVFEDGILGM